MADEDALSAGDSTLSKGLMILETLSDSPAAMGVTGLSAKLGLTKSNTHRLLRTLLSRGYVRQEPNKTYAPTLRTWKLGEAILRKLDLTEFAAAQMNSLASATGEAVYLAVRDELNVLYIDKIDSVQPIRTFTPKGGHAPLHCVATGKVLLAFDYERLRERVIEKLERFTAKTITSARALDEDMDSVLRTNIALDRGEYRDKIYSIASAIFDPSGRPVAAIGVSAPEVNLRDGDVAKIARKVHQCAAEVSDAIAQR